MHTIRFFTGNGNMRWGIGDRQLKPATPKYNNKTPLSNSLGEKKTLLGQI